MKEKITQADVEEFDDLLSKHIETLQTIVASIEVNRDDLPETFRVTLLKQIEQYSLQSADMLTYFARILRKTEV